MALLDINLSGENTGVDLARSLKSRWGVPVIFLSGDVTAAAQNAELAAAMVIKPYRGRDVLDALSRLESA
ncbi:response regulator [Brevundimonas diminuta ATCC 11568]|nr:response regulator [Brevundimonas diminuta ATCC 11568]